MEESPVSRIAWAMPRDYEDRPEWTKCCQQLVEYIDYIGEILIDLDKKKVSGKGECMFCKAPKPETKMYAGKMPDGRKFFFEAEYLEIDEGILEGVKW